jgi:hypothetical protein
MSGRGYVSFWVFMLCSRKSMTVHNHGGSPFLPGLGIHNIGTVLKLVHGTHHFNFTYVFLFSTHCFHRGSGHFDSLHLYFFVGSIKGM